jgi:hypothetical protein
MKINLEKEKYGRIIVILGFILFNRKNCITFALAF